MRKDSRPLYFSSVFDIEIITAPGPYKAVVSFLSDDLVRSYIEECLVASVSAAAEQAPEAEVIRRFSEHSEQRFRLNYLLGNVPLPVSDDTEKDTGDNDGPSDPTETSDIPPEERTEMEKTVRGFVDRIRKLGAEERQRVAEALNYSIDLIKLTAGDRDSFFELLEQNLLNNDAAQSLIDEIFDEVRTKFDNLTMGTFQLDRSGWPVTWTYEAAEREQFLKTVNRLSSNYAPNFGRLLTPLVSGLRASGPFSPTWMSPDEQLPKLVLMDGEGLGHTAALHFTLPTTLTRRYDRADVILLVDSAKQPMQAGAIAVLRSLAATGHDMKLSVVFTHYDQLEGDNLPNATMKKNHVLSSLENALQALEQDSELSALRTLRRHLLDNHVFYLSNIHKELPEGARATRAQFITLLEVFQAAITPVSYASAAPIYDLDRLLIPVRQAAEKFHQTWNARLGLVSYSTILPEHWTRIKALTRRLAYQWSDSYDTLQPVADLIRLVTEQLDAFITEPRGWKPAKPTEQDAEEAIRSVRQEVHSRLHDLAAKRIFNDQVRDWMTAYQYRGTGSTVQRAGEVRAIFEDATPIISERPVLHSKEFLEAISRLFEEAVSAAGNRGQTPLETGVSSGR